MLIELRAVSTYHTSVWVVEETKEELGVSPGWYLGLWWTESFLVGKGVCSPRWSNRTQHRGCRGEGSAELVFWVRGEKPDVSRAGERLRGLRGHWVSNTVTGLPWQPSGSPSRRHPGADGQKKRDLTMEGSNTSLKTTGSGSASCRVVSKKPEDRPSPRRAEEGRGFPRLGAEPCFWQLLGPP